MSWIEIEQEYKQDVQNLLKKWNDKVPYDLEDYMEYGISNTEHLYWKTNLKYGLPEELIKELNVLIDTYKYRMKNDEHEQKRLTYDEWAELDGDFCGSDYEGWLSEFKANIVTDNERFPAHISVGPADVTEEELKEYWAEEPIPSKGEKVNHPSHYTKGGMEVIDVLEAFLTPEEFNGFLKGNVIKYILRAGYKEDEIQDLQKCGWYLDRQLSKLVTK